MSVELITGYAGTPHISSADDGARNIGTFGAGKYVLSTGTQLACTVQGANTVVIGAGDVLLEGRHVRITGTNEVAIDNGAQGRNRNDIVCLYYQRNQSTTVESVELVVLEGAGTSGTPSDPAIPSGSIAEGANEAYMPLWRIPISGITPGTPVKLFGDVLPDMHEIATRVTPVAQIPNISAAKITSGTLAVARGGTGAATFSPHAVLVGPSSGTAAAAPTRRTLVAADLPDSITSDTSGNAATATKATKLNTARSLYVNLGASYDSSNPVTFDGSANKALPVTGTLPPARGGTGQASLQATRNAMGLGNTTGALPVANGGTGLAASPSMLVNLASTSAANVLTASPRPGVTGKLGVGNGGTGLTSSPSMLTNLGSTSAANVMQASPRPGITGTLGIAHGGTDATTAAGARANLGITLANLGAQPAAVKLFENTSGARGTINISGINNYTHLKVYYMFNETSGTYSDHGCVEMCSSSTNFTMACSAGHDIDATHAQLSVGTVKRQNGGLYVGYRSYVNFTNGAAPEVGRDEKFWVYRVEGWN